MAIRVSLFIALGLLASFPVLAETCSVGDWRASLRVLRNQRADEETRGFQGVCLVRTHLSHPEVAAAIVAILKNPQEPLFVREDLVEALSATGFRRTIAIREPLTPGPISPQDKEAVGRTVASASSLLAMAERVKTLKEVLPVTAKETEIVRALGEIVIDEDSHVILREMAVKALVSISGEMKESGVYSEHTLHVAYESMRYASLIPGEATYFIGAASAYSRVLEDHNQILAGIRGKSTRGLASEKKR